MNQNERACHLDICGIDIPKELNDALAAGKLVVFAGAGVSMQPPHGFRPFDQLVLSIGENVDPSGKCKGLMGNGESCEAALGRLADVGDVHEACASQLKDATVPICTRISSGFSGESMTFAWLRRISISVLKKQQARLTPSPVYTSPRLCPRVVPLRELFICMAASIGLKI